MKKLFLLISVLLVVLVLSACAQSQPPPPPPPAPTPAPAPAPPPAPAPSPAPVPPASSLVVQADIVRGHSAPLGPVCSNISQLAQGEMAVPRVKVLDPITGEELTDEALASVTWHLEDGQSFPMNYGGHGGNKEENIPPTDYFWTAGWDIPADYPTGTVKWWVTAESSDGRSGRYEPINMAISMLTITERTAPSLVIQADIVRGHSAPLGPVCSNVSQLAQGEMAVPRVKVLDPITGEELTDETLASVTWHLEDGQSFPMNYGGHGGNKEENIPPTDYFWTTGWDIPADYPTGTVKWWVTAESNDGRSGRYEPINMAISMLTIIESQ